MPEVGEYAMEEANHAHVALKERDVRGAEVLRVEYRARSHAFA
jgi:hypothetical protein